jgi:hypothetical protein
VDTQVKKGEHVLREKKYSGSNWNFVFFTCSPFFTLGLTIQADVRKFRPLHIVISGRFVNLFGDLRPVCGTPPKAMAFGLKN